MLLRDAVREDMMTFERVQANAFSGAVKKQYFSDQEILVRRHYQAVATRLWNDTDKLKSGE